LLGWQLDLYIMHLLRSFQDFMLLILLPHGLNHKLALSLVEGILLVEDSVRELILEFVV
jgi:hypothetical protein